MTALQLIPAEEMLALKAELSEIKSTLKQRPETLFQFKWLESSKVPPLLGISPRTWQAWRDKRVIPFTQFGNKIYVNLEDLDKFLIAHSIEARLLKK